MTTLKKPEVNLDYLDQPIKAKGWKNLTFTKCVNTIWGKLVWPTEREARAAADEWEKEDVNPDYGCKYCYFTDENDKRYRWPQDYSHTIQIPWKD